MAKLSARFFNHSVFNITAMMPPPNHEDLCVTRVANATFGEFFGPSKDGQAMALLALSHTTIEHQLYQVMRAEVTAAQTCVGSFTVRRLMALTDLGSFSTIRRGLIGLHNKLSIEYQKVAGIELPNRQGSIYRIFSLEEIFARRRAAGLKPYPQELQNYQHDLAFSRTLERVVDGHNLSRREAQVALCCAEGLTNAQIGERLFITEQTVKFHLRHIFVKFGVKRRAELVSRLLAQRG